MKTAQKVEILLQREVDVISLEGPEQCLQSGVNRTRLVRLTVLHHERTTNVLKHHVIQYPQLLRILRTLDMPVELVPVLRVVLCELVHEWVATNHTKKPLLDGEALPLMTRLLVIQEAKDLLRHRVLGREGDTLDGESDKGLKKRRKR